MCFPKYSLNPGEPHEFLRLWLGKSDLPLCLRDHLPSVSACAPISFFLLDPELGHMQEAADS